MCKFLNKVDKRFCWWLYCDIDAQPDFDWDLEFESQYNWDLKIEKKDLESKLFQSYDLMMHHLNNYLHQDDKAIFFDKRIKKSL